MRKITIVAVSALAALMAVSCGTGYSSRISEGARNVVEVTDVPNRCEKYDDQKQRNNCENMRTEARAFVGKLEALQQLCLEGNPLGNGVTSRCVVRGVVEDVNLRGVQVKIRDAYPDSGFKVMDTYWFSNDAMVDIYLYSMGFRNPEAGEQDGAPAK